MNAGLAYALTIFLGAVPFTEFETRVIPIGEPQARVVIAPVEEGRPAGLFVLSGNTLTLHRLEDDARPMVRNLPEGVSAFDLADITGDGRSEILAVKGSEILSMDAAGDADSPVEVLFECDTLFARGPSLPFPHVLAVAHHGERLLALPRESSLDLRRPDGTRVDAYPVSETSRGYGSAFIARALDPPQAGKADALEIRVDNVREFRADMPEGMGQPAPGYGARHGTPRRLRDAGALDYEQWPWFPLRSEPEAGSRVLFALGGRDFTDTRIRIRTPQAVSDDNRGAGGFRVGPERRYRGSIIAPAGELPDFDGDGFTDIVLWNTPRFGTTVDSIAQTMVRGTWSLQLHIHLFSPEKNRYEPAPATVIRRSVPVRWFLAMEGGAPLRHSVFADFDGDGKTDIGFSDAANRFLIWLERGRTTGEPDYSQTFPAEIASVEGVVELDDTGRAALLLRSEGAIFVVRAAGSGSR